MPKRARSSSLDGRERRAYNRQQVRRIRAQANLPAQQPVVVDDDQQQPPQPANEPPVLAIVPNELPHGIHEAIDIRHANVHLAYLARHRNPQVQPFYAGPMDITCTYCAALRFPKEKMNCCHSGKVALEPVQPYPHELRQLLTGSNAISRNFHDNIRQYNSAFAFASFGAQLVPPAGRGPYCFRIHGQVYHRSGSLYPAKNTSPMYSQLYILEGDQAVEERLKHSQNQSSRQI